MESSRLHTSLANLGNTPAIISSNGRVTYDELNQEWQNWKTRLQSIGIRPGSVVALEADYNTDAVAALIALLDMKAITVPISSLPEEKREEILTTSGARFYI